MRTRWSIPALVILLGSLVGCDALPPERPTSVDLLNESESALFTAYDRLPFRIIDSDGTTWRPDARRAPLCFECDEVCSSSMHGDPAPTWREISAQQSTHFSWDGRLYLLRKQGCSCGSPCYDAEALQDGSYELVLEYELALPPRGAPYRDAVHDGVKRWTASAMGWAQPTLERRFKVSISGQPAIKLTFDN